MMGELTSPTALSHATGPVMALLACLGLSGCSGHQAFPSVLYLAVGTNSDQDFDSELLDEVQGRLDILEHGYRRIRPATRFQLAIYPEATIHADLIRRNRAGLGPDLILVNGDSAVHMLANGLTTPFPATPGQLRLFNPVDLARLRTRTGELAGLPLVIQTQVACFNRTRLPQPPRTLAELTAASSSGHPMGLSVELQNLIWTAGSLGAVNGLKTAVARQQPSAGDAQRIEHWLAWLQNAGNQQGVTFYADQKSALSEFMAGRLDWMPCNSTSLPRLRKQLGSSLGVSALPTGPGGSPPSPVKRIRVLALGKSSSPAGRARAIAFTRFTTNPLMQRTLTIGSQTVLPANRFVKVAVQSSPLLDAMDRSNQQSATMSQLLRGMRDNDPRLPLVQNLVARLIFGEISGRSCAQALIRVLKEER
jgi:maltose-binding protein MalE